ncbi:hypothetical protein GCM10027275_20960 [Rhabdobacter roseus]|uniref:DUF4097 domain-containing protein n=1 Tax=Rhabdobacter roseus TaxID=1655419 RepID=A0A840TVP6_9BACT|nr:DUF4097 family beta strand repeat-containing protein [Rhabdobacter roseus]MBB5284030.1 hypothetical protein [Rhabdobacter roseus]
MKKQLWALLGGLVLGCTHSEAQNQKFSERVRQEFTLVGTAGASTLVIYNINGFIRVEGTSGSTVSLEAHKQLTAKDQLGLDKGKQEFKLGFEQRGDTIFAYLAEPYDSRPSRERRDWGRDKLEYDFTVDFTVKVPRAMNLNVSTINRGDVTVKDVSGSLRVRNINGAIGLTNASGLTDAHTINGNLEATYASTPADASAYYTLNGDIKVSYPASLSADLQFKSFQGEFYTDFPQAETLPAQVVKNKEKRGDKTVYKLNKTTAVRIGNGGKTLRFETFNGNVYIKKQS